MVGGMLIMNPLVSTVNEESMPVRKIPKNHIHVTGRHAAKKSASDADFESPLEAEHLLLLDHDPRVKAYEVQPVEIPVPGVRWSYVPDVLVEFHPDKDGVIDAPEVREVKSTLDLQLNEEKYAPKFEAARCYCEQRGWLFRVITEKEIRTPRLSNVKFVRVYEDQQHSPDRVNQVLERLQLMGRTDSGQLLNNLSADFEEQMRWLPVIWHLVAKYQIAVNWDHPFGSVVPMWPVETSNE